MFKLLNKIKNLPIFSIYNETNYMFRKKYYIYLEKLKFLLNKPIFLNSAVKFSKLGIQEFKKENYYAAIKYFSKAYEIYPQDGKLCYNFALTYHKMSEFEKALNLYRLAIRYGFKDPDVFFNLGMLYSSKGKYDIASNYFERVLNSKDDPIALYNLALLNAKNKKFDMAFDRITKLLNISDLSTLKYIYDFAQELNDNSQDKNYDFLIKLYSTILQYDQNDDKAMFSIIKLHFEAKNFNSAKQYCNQILSRNPNSYEAIHFLGVIFYEEKNFYKAIDYFTVAIKISPSNSIDSIIYLAHSYDSLHKTEHSIKLLKEALMQYENPKDINIIRDNLKIYFQRGYLT